MRNFSINLTYESHTRKWKYLEVLGPLPPKKRKEKRKGLDSLFSVFMLSVTRKVSSKIEIFEFDKKRMTRDCDFDFIGVSKISSLFFYFYTC